MDKATQFAAGLVANGLKKGDAVGIWAQNTPKWLVVVNFCKTLDFFVLLQAISRNGLA